MRKQSNQTVYIRNDVIVTNNIDQAHMPFTCHAVLLYSSKDITLLVTQFKFEIILCLY